MNTTMGQVLSFFKKVTGQSFYPNPITFTKELPNKGTVKEALDKVDDIIAQQAADKGCNHGTAQLCTEDTLTERACEQFQDFIRWCHVECST